MRALLFIALTYFVSFLFAGTYWALGGKWQPPGALLVAAGYMFIPMVVAIFLQAGVYRQPVRGPLGISFALNRWFLVAWLLPPALAFAALAAGLLLPGVNYDPTSSGLLERVRATLTPEQLAQVKRAAAVCLATKTWWIVLLQALIAGVTVNAIAGFGEELGWRGFLQKELSWLGFWKSSGVIGLVWGFWHTPIILMGHNYPQHPAAGVFMMTVFTLLLAPILSYVRRRANSVIAAAILHGTLNATAGFSLLASRGGSDLTVGMTGLAGLCVLAVVNLCLFVFDPALRR
jgi:membrane protease YdiL (CAAX protease family)